MAEAIAVVGVIATAATFVDLALKSAKKAHTFLSGVRDGPKAVKQAANAIEHLSDVLTRLANCQAPELEANATLKRILPECQRDLTSFSDKLASLNTSSTRSRREEYLKRFMVTLNEKELEKITSAVTSYASIISADLNAMQIDTALALPGQIDAVCNAVVTNGKAIENTTSVLRRLDTLHQQSSQVLGQVPSKVDGLSQQLHAAHAAVEQQVVILKSIEQTISAQLTSAVEQQSAMLKSIEQTMSAQLISAVVSPLRDGLDSFRHAETRVADDMRDLKQLTQQLMLASPKPSHRVVEVENDDPRPSSVAGLKPPPFSHVMAAISQLCDAVPIEARNTGTLTTAETENVLEHLLVVLELWKTAEFLDSLEDLNRENWKNSTLSVRQRKRDLKSGLRSIHGILETYERVRLNAIYNESRSGRKRKLTEAQASWDISTSHIGFGRLIFLRRKRPRKAENDGEDRVESQTSITFIPTISGLRQMINVKGHTPFWDDTESLPPVFSINNVLKAGSKVFHVVFKGDVEELKRMFGAGEASIRDHDEHGASLLHYGNRSPEMCEYLLHFNVLDVNAVANDSGIFVVDTETYGDDDPDEFRSDNFSSALYPNDEYPLYDYAAIEDYHEGFARILACRSAMLKSGADPTAPSIRDGKEILAYRAKEAFEGGRLESMTVMLDHGDCFVGVNSLLDGFTPLQHYCRGGCWSIEVLEWFLDTRGADPNQRNSNGQTVLHIIFESRGSGTLEAVVLLLKRGANPTAVDNDGKSVSYYAYHDRSLGGSMAGDIWDSALVRCGHDLWDFRRGYPWRFNRTGWYGRKDFERIWRGQEHLCPYYDDLDAFYFDARDPFYFDEDADADADADAGRGHDEKTCLQCKENKEIDEKNLEEWEKRAGNPS